MTFQWAETVFLARWFRDLNDETKENVRALIKRGQLEIVLGGWVMPDEASTHYITVVDQLIEGHQWLDEHLSVKPTTAWVNDPFGYSTTMPYLWKLSGMDNLLILRINQNLKAKLMSKNSLEFFWRPYWKHLRNDSDVLTSLMPFTNYWIDDVCGPNQIICSIFNYLHIGEKGRNAVQVTEENVHILAELLYRQLRVTGELYQFNNLYIGLGEDFSYTRAQEWDNTYLNFEKILTYINNKSEWNMRIKFGTMSEYFANIRQQAKLLTSIGETTRNAASTFPVLSGDFFPYTERNQEFWTGYFTTRPLLKKFSRDIETLIRGADIFNVMAHSMFKHYWVRYAAMTAVAAELTAARRDLAMFMHHDGITEKQELFSVSFAVDIPAFGIEVYTLKPTQQENNIMSYLPVTSEEHPLKISNDHIACVFNASTGMLQSVTVNNVETKMEAQFMIYQSDHGGAYIFGPKGEANRFKTEKLEILRVHGNLWSEVIIRSNGFVERYRLFNIEGIQGLGVHISTEVDIAAVGANNVDVIYRFNTDVNNDINFYTDQNGYQLMGRKTNSSHRIESNYYPMVTMMVIEDSNTRLTLHSKQAHGVSSLTSGQFEVMLDRHTFRDDGRGLGQGVYDNVRVNSDFVLQLEHKKSKTQTQEERKTN
ncbi:alpha-mannosidase 2x-like [Dreissena polymorpha]|uniref:alpha-mannosidase 2x-like n=1 Tax=Dreissena polymorpha TaxID=45954 RepID=UPI0022655559|nr:alpha-mannosidase 2x-like [Dreissena polymorpha]